MSAFLKSWVDTSRTVHSGLVLETNDNFSVIDCACCRFKHVVPLPTLAELSDIYSNEYYTTEKPLYIKRYLEDKAWLDLIYEDRYSAIEECFGGRRGKILDIGSGPGLFLAHGRDRGWQTVGVEPSVAASHYSRTTLGLDIRNIFLTAQTARDLGQFDVINMSEVLEHIPNPTEMLSLAKGLLKDGGVLCLSVPNDFNPIQRILQHGMGFSPWWVAPPHHLNYFDRASLTGLVKRAGFEVSRTESTFPIDIFLLMGINYIGSDDLGRYSHGLRKNLEINLLTNGDEGKALFKELQNAFANLGLGRELVLLARKNATGPESC